MRQVPTENKIKQTKHIRARGDRSEGLSNDNCNIFAVTNLAIVMKKKAWSVTGFASVGYVSEVELVSRLNLVLQ